MNVPTPADEPAVYTGGAMALFAAAVTAATAFGLIHWTPEQQVAAAGVAIIVLPALQGLITRQWVRPAGKSIPVPPDPGSTISPG